MMQDDLTLVGPVEAIDEYKSHLESATGKYDSK